MTHDEKLVCTICSPILFKRHIDHLLTSKNVTISQLQFREVGNYATFLKKSQKKTYILLKRVEMNGYYNKNKRKSIRISSKIQDIFTNTPPIILWTLTINLVVQSLNLKLVFLNNTTCLMAPPHRYRQTVSKWGGSHQQSPNVTEYSSPKDTSTFSRKK